MSYLYTAVGILLLLLIALAVYSRLKHCPHETDRLPEFKAPGPLVHSRSSTLSCYIAPLEYVEMDVVLDCIRNLGWTVLRQGPAFLHCECRSRIFGFADDVYLEFDKLSGQVYMCSCSRVGLYDFKVNRRRLERLRQSLQDSALVG